tara:strand:+ start:191 stop:1507 length:1317 start_codon:yes stop_codon:yes gene_type:complete
MSFPTLTPESSASAVVLPVTGTFGTAGGNVTGSLPFGIYNGENDFITGAVAQVAYTYKRLGGDVLDLEITEHNVYSDYEAAVLEYSYIVNTHQAKNVLSDLLGTTTGTFDHNGELKDNAMLSGAAGIALRYPRFEFSYAKRVADGVGLDAGVGGNMDIYSASFATVAQQQDYDLQAILVTAAGSGKDASGGNISWPASAVSGSDGTNIKVDIRKVYYKTPHAMWRFYGYYGGLNTVGNLSNYGQFSDDSTFEVLPAWQNKAQAMAFEDAIWTRNSHFSYELRNNKLRIFPSPQGGGLSPDYMWFEFSIPRNPYEIGTTKMGIDGVNNLNTAPFENIPYANINSIGKQWIRRYALALSKETLGQVRSKFGNSIPIPGENLSLNGGDLLSQAKEEQDKLRTELKELLDQLTYTKMAEDDKNLAESVVGVQKAVPLKIFVG